MRTINSSYLLGTLRFLCAIMQAAIYAERCLAAKNVGRRELSGLPRGFDVVGVSMALLPGVDCPLLPGRKATRGAISR